MVSNFSIFNAFLQANIINQLILILLVILSVYSWSIIIAKYVAIKNSFKLIGKLSNLSREKDVRTSLKMYITTNNNVYIPILRDIVESNITDNALDNFFENYAIDIQKNLSALATLSSVAPFVGLLGTVIGVISSFTAIGLTKSASLAVIAPGIAEALYATALGLFVAIPASWAYNIFANKINALLIKNEQTIKLLINEYIKENGQIEYTEIEDEIQ
jgi:biopolymer transport protein TolQ